MDKRVFEFSGGRTVELWCRRHFAGITEDNAAAPHDDGIGTGHRVWPASSVICKYIEQDDLSRVRGKTVLEVGAGPGLCGLLAAQAASRVILTDVGPNVLSLLEANAALSPRADIIEVRPLDWAAPVSAGISGVDLVLGSDVTYTYGHINMLVGCLRQLFDAGAVEPHAQLLIGHGCRWNVDIEDDAFPATCLQHLISTAETAGFHHEVLETCSVPDDFGGVMEIVLVSLRRAGAATDSQWPLKDLNL
eukprot:jgi/Mesvir1/3797/Mv02823-RA.1